MKILNSAFTSVLLLPAIIAGIVSSSCRKGDPARPPLRSNLPIIDSIAPKSGPAGTEVAIFGRNLGNSTAVVTINGKPAANKTSSDTRLVIIIADSGSTGPVVVKNTSGQATGPIFNYVLTTSYKVSVFAGNGSANFADGTGTAAKFNNPSGIAIDASGNLYVSDTRNHRIRKITPGAVVTTLAGSGTAGFANSSSPGLVQFNNPVGIVADQSNNVYVADEFNHRIRKITPAGAVTTFAGSTAGSVNGAAAIAQFSLPIWLIIDKQGNFYVTEIGFPRIRFINTALTVSNFAGGNATGAADGTGASALFSNPQGMALDGQNANLYVADYGNNKIRKISIPAGVVTSPIGLGRAAFADGTGTAAGFSGPAGLATDPSGNIFVADYDNQRIRKVWMPQLEVSTLAGNGSTAFADGNGDKATFKNPAAIATDAQGNLYIADASNNRIRKMVPYTH